MHRGLRPDAPTLAGWRIYVTNSTPEDVSLVQATALYREEWTVEHGFHRWKGGQLPTLPLFLHIEWRIRGLMRLLLIALHLLGLLEWRARRTFAAEQATVAGLVPGNPKMATAHRRRSACCPCLPVSGSSFSTSVTNGSVRFSNCYPHSNNASCACCRYRRRCTTFRHG